jgi:hypothetical protein
MTTTASSQLYRTLIVGAGPAGTGPLVGALQREQLELLLDAPIAIVDLSSTMGRGLIGQYVINSDTVGSTLLECLRASTQAVFGALREAQPTRIIDSMRTGAVPLHVVGEYMALIGAALQQIIESHPGSCFLGNTTATQVQRQLDGSFATTLTQRIAGQEVQQTLYSEQVVWALGASQSRERTLAAEIVSGLSLHNYDAKIMLTGEALTVAGIAKMQQRLQGVQNPKVLIIGGSHSAFSSAWTLLNKVQGVAFGESDITILHRDKLKIFYPSREAALAEGYTDFTDADFCPVTNRLYRLGGFRLDSRELLMRIWGMRGADVERRVQLYKLTPATDDRSEIQTLLDQADLIIPAFGYRPNTLPLLDIDGNLIEVLGTQAGAPPLVDTECRVLDAAERAIPGLYGIGLASGFKLTGTLGGEPSFTGQTNGLWLYQNGVGEIILNRILARELVATSDE